MDTVLLTISVVLFGTVIVAVAMVFGGSKLPGFKQREYGDVYEKDGEWWFVDSVSSDKISHGAMRITEKAARKIEADKKKGKLPKNRYGGTDNIAKRKVTQVEETVVRDPSPQTTAFFYDGRVSITEDYFFYLTKLAHAATQHVANLRNPNPATETLTDLFDTVDAGEPDYIMSVKIGENVKRRVNVKRSNHLRSEDC